jgi:hypothetical protein
VKKIQTSMRANGRSRIVRNIDGKAPLRVNKMSLVRSANPNSAAPYHNSPLP